MSNFRTAVTDLIITAVAVSTDLDEVYACSQAVLAELPDASEDDLRPTLRRLADTIAVAPLPGAGVVPSGCTSNPSQAARSRRSGPMRRMAQKGTTTCVAMRCAVGTPSSKSSHEYSSFQTIPISNLWTRPADIRRIRVVMSSPAGSTVPSVTRGPFRCIQSPSA